MKQIVAIAFLAGLASAGCLNQAEKRISFDTLFSDSGRLQPFRGEAVISIDGANHCGMHHVPLRKQTVYTFDWLKYNPHPPESAEYLQRCFPNCVHGPYERQPYFIWNIPVEVEVCPICEDMYRIEYDAYLGREKAVEDQLRKREKHRRQNQETTT